MLHIATQPGTTNISASPHHASHSWLPIRLAIATAVLLTESLGLARSLAPVGPYIAAPVLFITILLFFRWKALTQLNLPQPPLRGRFLVLHLFVLALLAVAAVYFYRARPLAHGTFIPFAIIGLTLLGITLIPALINALALHQAFRPLALGLPQAAVVTSLALSARSLSYFLWNSSNSLFSALQAATFAATRATLHLIYPSVYSRTSDHVLGTRTFGIRISPSCSGIESLALMLVLSTAWLLYIRRDIRFLRALCLIPLALALTWMLNVLRIALLITIGSAGHPHFALTGFHSHAGWVLFNAAALSFLFVTLKLPWLQRSR